MNINMDLDSDENICPVNTSFSFANKKIERTKTRRQSLTMLKDTYNLNDDVDTDSLSLALLNTSLSNKCDVCDVICDYQKPCKFCKLVVCDKHNKFSMEEWRCSDSNARCWSCLSNAGIWSCGMDCQNEQVKAKHTHLCNNFTVYCKKCYEIHLCKLFNYYIDDYHGRRDSF
jgi:hypothetical protein